MDLHDEAERNIRCSADSLRRRRKDLLYAGGLVESHDLKPWLCQHREELHGSSLSGTLGSESQIYS